MAATMRTSTLRDVLVADRPHLAVLEDAQQLGLDGQGDLAHLVEEERAAVRPPRTGPGGSRSAPVKAPLLVAEQLALEQALRQRRAVLGHEGPRGARPMPWIARATSSFPVPLSPISSTPTIDNAARSASSMARSSPGPSEKIPPSRNRRR